MKTVAHVEAAECPDSVKTLAEWKVWRKAEDERMMGEFARQLTEYFTAQAAQKEGLFAEVESVK